ncbi:hypothetical protein [Kribbella sp. NPDC055071]
MTTPTGDDSQVSLHAGVRYEVAEDLFGDLIGWCAAQITAERKKSDPDPEAMQGWIDQAAAYSAERRALRVRDTAAVEAAIATYGPQVRALYPSRTTGRY